MYSYMYVHTCSFVVSSSVSDAQVTTIIPEDATNSTYSITVNCTINPDSTADMCEVTATANGQIIRTGNEYSLICSLFAFTWQWGWPKQSHLRSRCYQHTFSTSLLQFCILCAHSCSRFKIAS